MSQIQGCGAVSCKVKLRNLGQLGYFFQGTKCCFGEGIDKQAISSFEISRIKAHKAAVFGEIALLDFTTSAISFGATFLLSHVID